MPKEVLNTIDLFAGCGGLMEGFLKSGHYNSLAGVEWEINPCLTLRHRLSSYWKHPNAETEILRFDMQRTEELLHGFDDKEYGKHIGLDALVNNREIDAIIGGPPCQAYSLAGRIRDENGMRDDYRNFLFERYVNIVQHFHPKFFVFENVVGLLSAAPTGSPIKEKIHQAFEDAGYAVTSNFKSALFEVADFGIPQHRKRIIILGISRQHYGEACEQMLADFYEVIMPSMKQKQKTVREAIGDLPPLFPIEHPVTEGRMKLSHMQVDGHLIPNHVPRFHSQRDISVFRLLANDLKSGRNEYTSIESLKKLYTQTTGKKSNIHKYYVLREKEPSNTIPAHLYKDGMRHIHPDPEQARTITVREAARLQTFPDDFEFLGPMMAQYKMIGNAVPVDFAKIVATALYKLYTQDYNHGRILY